MKTIGSILCVTGFFFILPFVVAYGIIEHFILTISGIILGLIGIVVYKKGRLRILKKIGNEELLHFLNIHKEDKSFAKTYALHFYSLNDNDLVQEAIRRNLISELKIKKETIWESEWSIFAAGFMFMTYCATMILLPGYPTHPLNRFWNWIENISNFPSQLLDLLPLPKIVRDSGGLILVGIIILFILYVSITDKFYTYKQRKKDKQSR